MTPTAPTGWRAHKIDIAGAGVCVLVVLLGYLAGIAPLVRRKTDLARGEARLGEQRVSMARAAARLEDIKARLADVTQDIHRSPVRLVPAYQVNQRIAGLSGLVRSCGMETDEIWPEEARSGPRYETVPIRLIGRGGFPKCVLLLRRLRETFPDTAVASLDLAGDPAKPDRAVRFQINLLWYASAAGPQEKG